MFDSWVGKILWWRKWQPTSIFLPGKLYGQRSLASYSPWSHKELDTTERLSLTPHAQMRLSTFHMLIDLCPLVKCLFKFCPFFYWVDCLFCIFWIQVICWMHCKNILGKKLFFSVFELWYMPLYWTPVSELMYYFILFIHFIIVHLSVWCIFFHSPGYRQGAGDAAQIKVGVIAACMEFTPKSVSCSP